MHQRGGSLVYLTLPNVMNRNEIKARQVRADKAGTRTVRRWSLGLGLAALAATTVGVCAPQAAAGEIAPGLSCENDLNCRNDTDDTYRVTSRAECTGVAIGYTTDSWIAPHSTGRVKAECPSTSGLGSMRPQTTIGSNGQSDMTMMNDFGDWEQNYVVGIKYLTAQVDNSHQNSPSGSAG
ncbi:hypothetical protein [Nocardia tengchongensis]